MRVITTTPDLDAFCQKAAGSAYLTLDTEFVRESTYWPELCLIQVGLKDEAVAIDPLAEDIDLNSFFSLLQNPAVLKVVHSGRQDIEIFYHLTKKIPTPLFDTQIAAMVCGFGEAVAYDSLVQSYAKITIDKSARYTHWSARPLSDKQINYAIGDVTHLRLVYEKLHAKLITEGRQDWIADEMNILEDPNTYALDPYRVWTKLKIRSASPRMLAIVRELAAWRELMAQTHNLPRVRVIRDDALIELGAAAPKSMTELERLRGIPPQAIKKHGKEILSCIEQACALPLDECPVVKKPLSSGKSNTALLEMLKLLLKVQSEQNQVAPKLIATTTDLEELAYSAKPQTKVLTGWRYDIFGKAALDLKSGNAALGMKNNKIGLIWTS